MSERLACEDWPGALEPCVIASTHFNRVTVLRETESTQDAAVRLGAQAGDIVTTFRQTKGRGRLGRQWADTGEHGIATTFVIVASTPERLAMLSAVAAARAVASLLESADQPPRVGIRWPNDIMINRKKIAGILIEQDAHCARIGIGINVSQRSFPPELVDRACSLAQLGAEHDRAAALREIITSLDAALDQTNETLKQAFAERDVLSGTVATFEHNRTVITGRVVEVDPTKGLRVYTESGEVFLPAHSTSLQHAP